MRIEGPLGVIYRLSRRYVPTASQASGAVLWAFRNPSTLTIQLLQARLQLLQVGAPTAAIEDRFSLTLARTYTTGDTTGGTNITPAVGKQDLTAGSTNTPQITLHETNAAGGLTGGVRALDPNPVALGSVWIPIAIQTTPIQSPTLVFDYKPDLANDLPAILPTNRGFVITCDNALGVASGIVLLLDLMWAER